MTMQRITAEDLRKLPSDQVASVLSSLSPEQAEELKYDWTFWARPDQFEPEGTWNVWRALAGGGWG